MNGLLLQEADFDLNLFLLSSADESNEYIGGYKWVSIENIEQLAGFITQIGLEESSVNTRIYLEKALQLYELYISKRKPIDWIERNI